MQFLSLYSNNIIFQQQRPFKVIGYSKNQDIRCFLICDKEKVEGKVNFDKDKFTLLFKGVNGSFNNYRIEVIDSNKDKLVLKNIHFGDVYLMLGQSNMSYPLSAVEKWNEASKSFADLNCYCLNLAEADLEHEAYDVHRPFLPQEDICSRFSWEKVNTKNCLDKSALGMMLASLMAKKVDYPIGIINTAMGGLSIESYLIKEEVDKNKKLVDLLKWRGCYYFKEEEYNHSQGRNFTQLNGVFNEKINPLKNLSFKGCVWYLGESACYDLKVAKFYDLALSNLISSYRKFFNDSELPFLITEIADDYYPFGDYQGFSYVNETMWRKHLKNVVFVPTHDLDQRWVDISNKEIYYHPIHPRNKYPLAKRYCDVFYNRFINNKSYYYPYIESYKIINSEIHIYIKSLYKFKAVLNANGFTIAGDDNVYYPITEIKNNGGFEFIISSIYVSKPKNFTFSFDNYPLLNIIRNVKGQPLTPFRSKYEPVFKGCYLFNNGILNSHCLKVREQTFGYEVGGGFEKKIYDQSDIINEKVNISVPQNKSSIRVSSIPKKEHNYYYFAFKINISLSGARQNLEKFRCLLFDIAGDSNIEFHGALFRANGLILKMPIITSNNEIKPFINLKPVSTTYGISLETYLDGSECPYKKNKDYLKNLSSIDLYFRSQNKSSLELFRVVQSMKIDFISSFEDKKNDSGVDNNMVIPKNH